MTREKASSNKRHLEQRTSPHRLEPPHFISQTLLNSRRGTALHVLSRERAEGCERLWSPARGGGRLVRMEVSRESVATFGVLPPQETETRQPSPILAEVVVGDDGLARAVRFVRAATESAKKQEGR